MTQICVVLSLDGRSPYSLRTFESSHIKSTAVMQVVFLLVVLALTSAIPDLNVSQLIQQQGFPVEEYSVVTSDGFVLAMQRIPHGRTMSTAGKPAVLLQHGLLDASSTFVLNDASESLAFILADAGYDVWLGNNRGNVYSDRHVHYNTSDAAFWAWSFDELARYDVPAMIEFVLQVTGQPSLSWIGHSRGTQQIFAAALSGVEAVAKINTFIGLAPVTFVFNQKSRLLHALAELHGDELTQRIGVHDFFFRDNDWLRHHLPQLCDACSVCCAKVDQAIFGKSTSLNNSRLDVYNGHFPDGTSTQEIVHFAQLVRKNSFEMFDFGTKGNLVHYNQSTPPAYDLNTWKQTFPVYLFTGGADVLADPIDVARIVDAMTSARVLAGHVHVDKYAHMDFTWAEDANSLIYPQVLEALSKPR